MKHFKRAAAMLLAVVLSLCLAVTAFAADDTTKYDKGNLTVTGSGLYVPGANGATGEGKEVTAILMFTANASKKNDAAADANNEFDSYTLNEYWAAFFKDASRFEAVKKAGNYTGSGEISRDALSDASVAYVESLRDNDTAMAKLAHDAQKWVRAHSSTFEGLVKKQKAQQVSDDADKTKGTATFTELTAGYYLVFPEGGSTGDGNRGTDAILVNVPKNGDKTEVTIKSKFPTVDKKVQTTKDGDFTDNSTAQVGDTVTFKLTAKVPDMTDYDSYTFKFIDKLSNGLEFVADSVEVNIANNKITAGANTYSATYEDDTKILTVAFDDLTNVVKTGTDKVATDDEIIVTYKAKITKDAVKDNPAKNTVYLEYSNNPGTHGTGKSNPDESKVYTYDIEIHKFHTEDTTTNRLANAVFQLKNSDGNVVKLVADTANNSYYVAESDTQGEETVKTDADGIIKISGLKAGVYQLEETIAPTGYNKLKKPIKIAITVTGEAYTTPTYKVDEADQNTSNIIKVKNVKGVMLPETGSIGTIGLTALGVAVVLLGVFAPRKKKKENQ